MNVSRKAEPGFVVLAVLVLGMMLGLALMADGTPEVKFSLATGKPVSMSFKGEEIAVTPSTALPQRYEKVWVP